MISYYNVYTFKANNMEGGDKPCLSKRSITKERHLDATHKYLCKKVWAKNILYFLCRNKSYEYCLGGLTPVIRNISAVVFGANSMEYKPIETAMI